MVCLGNICRSPLAEGILASKLPKDKFTEKQAIAYVKKHFQFKKVDALQRKNYFSMRQFNPTPNSTYSTIKLKNGILLVVEYRHTIDKKRKGGALSVKNIYTAITNGYNKTKGQQLTPMIDGFLPAFSLSTKEATVYINKNTKHIIINYVGTYSGPDWANNALYVAGLYNFTRRYNDAKKVLENVLQTYTVPPYKITLCGHSQSGVILRNLNEAYPNKIYETIALNPASLGERRQPNEYNIRSDLDIVSLLNTSNIETIHHTSLNPVIEHMPSILERLPEDTILGNGRKRKRNKRLRRLCNCGMCAFCR
jgi:hypothetical protein